MFSVWRERLLMASGPFGPQVIGGGNGFNVTSRKLRDYQC
jgi:hypothetical protein